MYKCPCSRFFRGLWFFLFLRTWFAHLGSGAAPLSRCLPLPCSILSFVFFYSLFASLSFWSNFAPVRHTRHLFAVFNQNVHLEVAHGTLKDNYDYCIKEDSDAFVLKNEKKASDTKVEKADIGEMAEMAAKQGSEACTGAQRKQSTHPP